MAPTPREILDLALAQLPAEAESAAGELGRRLGLPYQRVYKWVTGANDPSADAALLIADKFGWLNLEATPTALLPHPRGEGLAEKMDAALDNQQRLWEQMEQLANAGVDLVASFELIREQVEALRTLIEAPNNDRRRAGRGG